MCKCVWVLLRSIFEAGADATTPGCVFITDVTACASDVRCSAEKTVDPRIAFKVALASSKLGIIDWNAVRRCSVWACRIWATSLGTASPKASVVACKYSTTAWNWLNMMQRRRWSVYLSTSDARCEFGNTLHNKKANAESNRVCIRESSWHMRHHLGHACVCVPTRPYANPMSSSGPARAQRYVESCRQVSSN